MEREGHRGEMELRGDLHGDILLYREDGVLLGYCKINFTRVYTHLQYIKSHRPGEGIGSTLLAEVERLSRERGLPRIHGRVLNDFLVRDPNLRGFYERRGYVLQPEGTSFSLNKELT